MSDIQKSYYLPEPSHWPITGSIGLFTIFIGAATWLNGAAAGPFVFCSVVFPFLFSCYLDDSGPSFGKVSQVNTMIRSMTVFEWP